MFIYEKMEENCLKWFKHVERRLLDAPMAKVNKTARSSKKGGGNPNWTLNKFIEPDLLINWLSRDFIVNQTWHHAIHMCLNPPNRICIWFFEVRNFMQDKSKSSKNTNNQSMLNFTFNKKPFSIAKCFNKKSEHT